MELVACPVPDCESLVEFTSGMVVIARFQYLLEVVLLALCPRTNAPAPVASRSVVGVHPVLRWFLASQGGGGPAMYQIGRILVPPNRGEQTKIQQGGFGLLEAARDAEWRLGHLGQIMAELGQFGRGALERFSCRGALPPTEFETQERETDAA